ncbi:hypothetical protein [Streptomonospora salina]|uniref:Uncharacterized protein n=1 Tax=Streptomonospora salina TaxID=104205 RepID=A0A841EKK8_9ACTN|nr:hypothetical protein [Streptomonospora salina]MBB6001318.1 hypothetical protein [Streptomonospora salina]
MADQTEQLGEMIANLQRYVEVRAVAIAEPRVAAAEQEAASRIAEAERLAADRVRRAEDLVEELRYQLGSAGRSRDRLAEENKRLKTALTRRDEQP